MKSSRSILKALQSGQLHRTSLIRDSQARDHFQSARFLSSVSEGASSKDGSETVSLNDKTCSVEASKQNGAESQQENIKKGTETAPKGKDVLKSEAAERTLHDLLKDTQALLKEKDKMVLQMKQEVLTHLAEVENVRGRTRRDAESIKHHAVETFATDLLDMADNLSRASKTVPESFLAESLATDPSGNAKLLKSLLEGVDMTHKQLVKIFNKFGVEKYDPIGEIYDHQQHLAITEVDDETKEPHTVVNVVKSGYFFKDKLIRVAEVDIVKKRTEAK